MLLFASFGAKRDLAVSDYLHDILQIMGLFYSFYPSFGAKKAYEKQEKES